MCPAGRRPGSTEHQVMQPGHVLHDHRVLPPRVPEPVGDDPPDLHLADPVLDHDPPLRQPPVPGFLPMGQRPPRGLRCGTSRSVP